jgi:integrase
MLEDYIEQSIKEYCEYIYNRIILKLTEAKEYQLLSFALVGMHLLLRQSDALRLKWEQVDFINNKIKNVYLIKGERKTLIECYDLEIQVIEALKHWYDLTEDKVNIFPNLIARQNSEKIGRLIGNTTFHSHDLRGIGVCLKYYGLIN